MAKTVKSKRQKGKNFENKVAEIIHNFLYENFKEYKDMVDNVDKSIGVKRDFSSGLFLNSKGDIDLGAGVKFFPFSIECKKREDLDISLKTLFNLKKSKLYSIYKNKCIKQAQKSGLTPLLVFSKNYTDIFVFLDISFLGDHFELFLQEKSHLKDDNIYILLLKDFLDAYLKYFTHTFLK